MKRFLLLIIFSCLLAPGLPASSAPEDENLKETIDYLVEFARTSDVVFIRNDKEHSAEEAASHMLRKYGYAKRKVRTAEDFIEYCAAKSTMSGKPYHVRLKDGRTITSAEWLLAALAGYRSGGAAKSTFSSIEYETREFRKEYGRCGEVREGCASVAIRYPEL